MKALLAIARLSLMTTVSSALPQEPVHWSAIVEPAASGARTRLTLRLRARIEEGWHIYSLSQGPGGPSPLRIALASTDFAQLSPPVQPLPRTAYDRNFGIDVEQFEDSATFVLALEHTRPASGNTPVTVNVRFQACDATRCLPPQTVRVTAAMGAPPSRRGGKGGGREW